MTAMMFIVPWWIIVTILCGACLVVGVLIYMTKDKR